MDGSYVRYVECSFIAERSRSLAMGVERWVVADARTYVLHQEATVFLASLRSRDRSPNTERVYAGRLALYLNYCAARRMDWAVPGFLGLSGLQQWLISTPLPPRSPPAPPGRLRAASRVTRPRCT